MIARVCACGLIATFAVTAAHGGTERLTAPGVQAALIANGYPARTQCGEVIEPPPVLGSHSHIFNGRSIPACWVVVERAGFSVYVTPHSNAAAATLAAQRTHNKWAKQSREAAIGDVLLSGYRITTADWLRISHLVASVATGAHP